MQKQYLPLIFKGQIERISGGNAYDVEIFIESLFLRIKG